MTDIDKAKQIVAALEAELDELAGRRNKLDSERYTVAYAAHANNDAKARERLDEIRSEAGLIGFRLETLNDAISIAKHKLSAAETAP